MEAEIINSNHTSYRNVVDNDKGYGMSKEHLEIGAEFYVVSGEGKITFGIVEEVKITKNGIYHFWNNGHYNSKMEDMHSSLEDAIKETIANAYQKFKQEPKIWILDNKEKQNDIPN